jgi:hypothetical protein
VYVPPGGWSTQAPELGPHTGTGTPLPARIRTIRTPVTRGSGRSVAVTVTPAVDGEALTDCGGAGLVRSASALAMNVCTLGSAGTPVP